MCVIFWTTSSDRYDLVIASNRDEFLSRPTLPASWHDFSSSSPSASSSSHRILSARDSTGGGTWLGVTRNGAFATLTNYTEVSAPLPEGMDAFESRGQLVRDWLVLQSGKGKGKRRELEEVREEVEGYLIGLGGKLDRFPGFNLLIGAVSKGGTVVGYITNRTSEGGLARGRKEDIFLPETSRLDDTSTPAPPGGMSNSILSEPWTKVTSGSRTFHSALHNASLKPKDHAEEALVEDLFDLLWTSSNPAPAQRSELRNSVLISPLELPLVGQRKEWYATRTSTVILVGKDGKAKLVERDTFKIVGDEARLVNGPEGSGAMEGRSGGQRVFEWTLE